MKTYLLPFSAFLAFAMSSCESTKSAPYVTRYQYLGTPTSIADTWETDYVYQVGYQHVKDSPVPYYKRADYHYATAATMYPKSTVASASSAPVAPTATK